MSDKRSRHLWAGTAPSTCRLYCGCARWRFLRQARCDARQPSHPTNGAAALDVGRARLDGNNVPLVPAGGWGAVATAMAVCWRTARSSGAHGSKRIGGCPSAELGGGFATGAAPRESSAGSWNPVNGLPESGLRRPAGPGREEPTVAALYSGHCGPSCHAITHQRESQARRKFQKSAKRTIGGRAWRTDGHQRGGHVRQS